MFDSVGRILAIAFFPALGLYDFMTGYGLQVAGYAISVFPFLLYCIVGAWAIANSSKRRTTTGGVAARRSTVGRLFLFYTILVVLGFYRSYWAGAIGLDVFVLQVVRYLAIVGFWLIIAIRSAREDQSHSAFWEYLSLSIGLYCWMNVIGAVLGFTNPGFQAHYTNVFYSNLVLNRPRLHFPFAGSGQTLAVLSGLPVIFGWWWFFRKESKARLIGILMALGGVFVILGHGARAPVAAILATGVLGFLKIGAFPRVIVICGLATVVTIPVMYSYADIGGIVGAIVPVSVMGGGRQRGSIETLSNRDVIWSETLDSLVANNRVGQWLFGYGAHGQDISGAARGYVHLFSNSYTITGKISVHNSFLQVLVDYGILGLLVVMSLVIGGYDKAARLVQAGKLDANTGNLVVYVLIYFCLTATTEAAITYYAISTWASFIAVVLALECLDRKRSQWRRPGGTLIAR